MTTEAEPTSIVSRCRHLIDFTAKVGRVPVSWAWGPKVREEFSELLDSMVIVQDEAPEWPDDGRFVEFCGLPAFPMMCEGIALRTVAAQ